MTMLYDADGCKMAASATRDVTTSSGVEDERAT
jgi:hypothetical protein